MIKFLGYIRSLYSKLLNRCVKYVILLNILKHRITVKIFMIIQYCNQIYVFLLLGLIISFYKLLDSHHQFVFN